MCLALGFFSQGLAQVCALPGRDGPATISGVVNTYYAGSGTATAGTSSLTLGTIRGLPGSSTPIAAGDLIVVMQMQDGSATDFSTSAATYGTNTGTAGLYEYARVSSVAGSTVNLASPLVNTYVQNFANRQTFQVIRVPQYSSATIAGTVTAAPWTVDVATGAATGGVVVLDVAGSLNMNATANINVAGQGFRGAAGILGKINRAGGTFDEVRYPSLNPANGASKGEGTAGTPRYVFNGTATPLDYTAEGYTNGSFGQGSPGNAGGGGNDGNPPTGTNQFNSGGGGGGNSGSGGIGGNSWSTNNAAGGRGGKAATNSATRLVMGGGGGAGSVNNNDTANFISSYPPIAITPTPRNGATNPVANGAQGPISLSGAAGGGIVLVRAGTISAVAGSQVNADGYRAYNSNGDAADGTSTAATSASEGAGGGGAGGSVFITTTSGNGTNLTINARGGAGGDSDFSNHGPGGGGGGGFVLTSNNLTGVVSSVVGAVGGLEGLEGQEPTPADNYGSSGGNGGLATPVSTSAPGVSSGASCLPVLTVAKNSLPTVTGGNTFPAGTTTVQYSVSIANAANRGPATGVNLVDDLPNPFQFAGGNATVVYAGGATKGDGSTGTTIAGTGTDPVTFGTADAPSASNFTIPSGGSVTLTFTVNLNGATAGTYQNPANTNFLDPTRTAATTTVQPGGAYQSGGGTAGGSNYASGSSSNDDVTLLALPTLTKTFNPIYILPGGVSVLTINIGNSNASALTLTQALTDTLPTNVAIAATPAAATTCSGTGAVTTTANSVTLPVTRTIPVGGCNITVNVTSSTLGVFTNSIPAGAVGNGGLLTNAGAGPTASAPLVVLEPAKQVRLLTDADTSGAPSVGDTVQYQIVYSLPTSAPAIPAFQIFDVLPTQVTYVGSSLTVTPSGGTPAQTGALNGGYTGFATNATSAALLTAPVTLQPGGIITATINATINGTSVVGTPFDNNARGTGTGLPAISGNGTGGGLPTDADATPFGTPASALPQPNDNTATTGQPTQVTTAAPNADLVVTKSQPSPATVNPGGTITYTVTVINNGPATAVNVVVRDTLPPGTTFGSATGGGTHAAGEVTWNSTSTPALASLANGASQTFTITVTAP
jgi:uncharacterized repeat protein (TIGR01451 family)/fimbrial isopeptide formation D2 family protein